MLKFILYAVFILVIVIIGVMFSSRNETEIAIDLFFGKPVSLGAGLWVLLSFIIGCSVAWLISWPSYLTSKIINKKQRRKLKSQQEEILRLKGDSPKGN
ncbi:MAG: putative membrane protein [Oleiphilaceae bacterium]